MAPDKAPARAIGGAVMPSIRKHTRLTTPCSKHTRSKHTRLKRRAEFLRVASRGRKAPTPGLVLQVLLRDDDAPVRLGFTVTKKVGNAVVRNRTRRRMREAARLLLRDNPATGADLVLVGRDTTRTRRFTDLIDDLQRSLRKLGVPMSAP